MTNHLIPIVCLSEDPHLLQPTEERNGKKNLMKIKLKPNSKEEKEMTTMLTASSSQTHCETRARFVLEGGERGVSVANHLRTRPLISLSSDTASEEEQ